MPFVTQAHLILQVNACPIFFEIVEPIVNSAAWVAVQTQAGINRVINIDRLDVYSTWIPGNISDAILIHAVVIYPEQNIMMYAPLRKLAGQVQVGRV